jgi:hypothetical protein
MVLNELYVSHLLKIKKSSPVLIWSISYVEFLIACYICKKYKLAFHISF